MFCKFEATDYYHGTPKAQLECLNRAVEYVLATEELERRFMAAVKRMRQAYNLCCSSDAFTEAERELIVSLANEVLDDIAGQLIEFLQKIKEEKGSHKDLGITFAEKVFFDILQAVSRKHEFEYPKDKMIKLAKRLMGIVDNKSAYPDWYTRDDIKAELQVDIILLMDEFGFPPVVIDDVYKEVLEQAENYKRNLPAFSGLFYSDVEEKVMEAAEEEK